MEGVAGGDDGVDFGGMGGPFGVGFGGAVGVAEGGGVGVSDFVPSATSKSEETGCGIMPTYPTPINEIPQISEEFEGQHYPNAQFLADCLMTLPVHEYIRERDSLQIQNLLNP